PARLTARQPDDAAAEDLASFTAVRIDRAKEPASEPFLDWKHAAVVAEHGAIGPSKGGSAQQVERCSPKGRGHELALAPMLARSEVMGCPETPCGTAPLELCARGVATCSRSPGAPAVRTRESRLSVGGI